MEGIDIAFRIRDVRIPQKFATAFTKIGHSIDS